MPDDPLVGMAEDQLIAVADDPLIAVAADLGQRCRELGLRLATVESCTGGLVGHLITETPGSSDFFVGGFVTYSDQLKRDLVGVPAEVLVAHGAVSAQVALAMAAGGRARTSAEVCAAVTGIAGPDGGSAQKPIGLTYVAVADAAGTEVRRHLWSGSRADNKRSSAEALLRLILDRIGARTDRS